MKKSIVPEEFQHYFNDWHFSPIIESDGTVYLSGVTAARKDKPISQHPEEQFHDAFYKLGNIREVEDKTTMAYSKEQLKENYKGSIMEAYLALFEQEELTEEMEKAFQYGVEAFLESGEELL